jgi:hypothetical protein
MALAGGGLRGGLAIGETDPEGAKKDWKAPDAVQIGDVYATVLTALGINPAKKNQAFISQSGTTRPISVTGRETERGRNLVEVGKVIKQLI